MISISQMMPTILERCPGFAPAWNKHREFWKGEEAGIYNDVGQFAHFVVEAYEHHDTVSVTTAFALCEEFLVDGDDEVRDAASIGFLEDVRNISAWRPFGFSPFSQLLGPQSMIIWTEIEKVWRGKQSLADVVRAERAAQKNHDKN